MPNRALDWLKQAERDLEQAADSSVPDATSGHVLRHTRPPRKPLKPFTFFTAKKRRDMW